jgi:hypothetical protein
MRSGLRVLVIGIILACVSWPVPASAGALEDIIAYLQGMSGPGPYNGLVLSGEIACFGRDRRAIGPCRSRDGVKTYVVLEKGWWNDKPNPNFVGNAYVHTYSVVAYVPVPKVRGLDIGAGFGVYRISGAAIQDPPLWRTSIPIRIRAVPSEFFASKLEDHPQLRAVLRSITYHFGWDILPQGFEPDSFFGPPGYVPEEHALRTNALTVDAFVLIDAIARRR